MYVRNMTEEIKRECGKLGVKLVFKSHGTLWQALMKVKTPRDDLEKKDVVYEVPCMDCDVRYIGMTGKDLKKRIMEHRYAVRRRDDKNRIAVHANSHNHKMDWEGAKVLEQELRYWKRRILEAIHIHRYSLTSNLDCGLDLNAIIDTRGGRGIGNGSYRRVSLSYSILLCL